MLALAGCDAPPDDQTTDALTLEDDAVELESSQNDPRVTDQAAPAALPTAADDLAAVSDPQGGYWGGWQPIIQVNSGMCLDAGGEAAGSWVRQHHCHFSQRQQWKFLVQADGSYFRMQNQASGLCLDSANGWLSIQPCGNGATQRFVIHDPSTPGLLMFESLHDHECWSIPGAWIDPYWVHGSIACSTTTEQQWVAVVPDNSYACGQ